MKRFILLVTLIFNGYIFADGHASPPMTAHYGFSTENPAAVVQNLQALMESDCGKEIPAVISCGLPLGGLSANVLHEHHAITISGPQAMNHLQTI
jgi:hypothetical protein